MIRNAIATRLASLAGVALSVAGLGALDAGAQGTVTLSGATGNTCTASSISIGSNGNLTVTCTGGPPPPTPVCSVAGSNTATVGTPLALSANCNPAATSWAWGGNGPLPSGQSSSVTFTAAGTYNYTVTGTNAAGAGPVSAAHTVTVSPARTGKPVCTFAVNPAAPKAGESATVSMSCTQTPTDYAWYVGSVPAGASITGLSNQTSSSSQNVTFTHVGTYQLWLQAGNPEFGGGDVFGATINVTNAGGGNCPTVQDLVGPQSAASLLNLRFDLRVGQTGTQSFPLPLDGFGAARITGTPATQQETPKSTIAEVWVSDCPGVKPANLPAGCQMELWGSTGQANFYVGNSPWSSCPLDSGKTYHVNIKHRVCVPYGGSINYCSNYLKVSGQ